MVPAVKYTDLQAMGVYTHPARVTEAGIDMRHFSIFSHIQLQLLTAEGSNISDLIPPDGLPLYPESGEKTDKQIVMFINNYISTINTAFNYGILTKDLYLNCYQNIRDLAKTNSALPTEMHPVIESKLNTLDELITSMANADLLCHDFVRNELNSFIAFKLTHLKIKLADYPVDCPAVDEYIQKTCTEIIQQIRHRKTLLDKHIRIIAAATVNELVLIPYSMMTVPQLSELITYGLLDREVMTRLLAENYKYTDEMLTGYQDLLIAHDQYEI